MGEPFIRKLGHLTIWLNDERQDIAYSVASSLIHTIDVPPSSLTGPKRATIQGRTLTCSCDFYVVDGMQFTPHDSGPLTIQVCLPAETEPRWWWELTIQALNHVYDWLMILTYVQAESLTQLGSGLLLVDRIFVHPVDYSPKWERISVLGLLKLFQFDFDQITSDTPLRVITYPASSAVFASPHAATGLIKALSHERPGVRQLAKELLNSSDVPPEVRTAYETYKSFQKSHQN